jgi:hypothetical protein
LSVGTTIRAETPCGELFEKAQDPSIHTRASSDARPGPALALTCGEVAMKTSRIAVLLLSWLAVVVGCYRPAPTARLATKPTAAPTKPLQQTFKEMSRSIEARVAAGFSTPDQVLESAVEVYSDEQPPTVLRPAARWYLDQALAKHAAAQRAWPAVTDCDRLDSAFADLEQRGIVARQNFSDCGTCGVAEIADEIAAARKGGRKVQGYVFYHEQDTESAVEGHGLHLNYGSVEEGENAAVKIADEVVKALKDRGLQPSWDGTWRTRIRVALDWKRRR